MTGTVLITPIGLEDIEEILRIETASFAQPWGRESIRDELAAADAVQFAARTPPTPQTKALMVGFLLARLLYDELHLMKVAVDPRWRLRGAAAALLRAARREARRRGAQSIVLEVRSTNRGAIGFYRKAGFEIVGVRPNYYPQTGEDALVMTQSLKEVS